MSSKLLDCRWREEWHDRHFRRSRDVPYVADPPPIIRSSMKKNMQGVNPQRARNSPIPWTAIEGSTTDCVNHFLATGYPVFMNSRGIRQQTSAPRRNAGLHAETVFSPQAQELKSASHIVDLSLHFEGCVDDSDMSDSEHFKSESENLPACTAVLPPSYNYSSPHESDCGAESISSTIPESPKQQAYTARPHTEAADHPHSHGMSHPPSNIPTTEPLENVAPAARSLSPAAATVAEPGWAGPGGLQPACDSEDDMDTCVALSTRAAARRAGAGA
jgi:hypothetical protein